MKKSELKTMVRKIVREEVAMAIQEVVTELKQTTKPLSPKKRTQNSSFTSNKVLNDVLNETAEDGDWKTLGGGEFTTERMNELVGKNYTDLMDNSSQPNNDLITSMGVNPNDPGVDFLKKDYRAVMKAIDKKQGK